MNVIADIAGQYKTLMALLKKMPDDEPVSVGDMVDRGPQSREVLNFFKNHGKAIYGNHEHLMVDFYRFTRIYEYNLWSMWNGGWATLQSYMDDDKTYCFPQMAEFLEKKHHRHCLNTDNYPGIHQATSEFMQAIVPEETVEWIESLPHKIEEDGYIITHGPINPSVPWEKQIKTETFMDTIHAVMWNRGKPRRIENKFQLYGHMSRKKVHEHKDKEGVYALGLDTSRADILTGYSTITKQIYQQEYIL